jgi:hypothetical protein
LGFNIFGIKTVFELDSVFADLSLVARVDIAEFGAGKG